MELHIGCSGWFYSHWRGIFYPAGEVTTKNWFAYYANVFRTVELNSPFYRWPKPSTVRRWYREAPPGFIYTVKVNQAITHEKRLVGTRQRVREYYGIADTLREKMGCFLFQFPPSFNYTAARLKAIVTQLDPARKKRRGIPPQELVAGKSLRGPVGPGHRLLCRQRPAPAGGVSHGPADRVLSPARQVALVSPRL